MDAVTPSELLARQLDDTRAWTLKLIADLDGDDWTFQPAPGLAHALWLCGHLATAQDSLIHKRCLGAAVLDQAFHDYFPIGRPIRSAAEYRYPSVAIILAAMKDMHARTCAAVQGMSNEFLAEPAFGADGVTPHPHYHDKCGAVSHCGRHEAFHAGQLAMLRRLRSKPFLR